MKLSELTTSQATDVLCELTPYIANITADEELLNVLGEKITGGKPMSRAEIMVFGAKKISTLAPIVLKDHKADVFGILAVLNEKTVEEIAEQKFLTTLNQIKSIKDDPELIDFFESLRQEAKTE